MTYLNPNPELIDGIDVDAVATAVRSCAGVDDLDAGQLGSVTSYLPGRKVPGIKVEPDRVTVQVRTRWGVPIADVGAQLREAVSPVIAGRTLHIVVSDLADPPAQPPRALPAAPEQAAPAQPPALASPVQALTDVAPSALPPADPSAG